MHRTRPSPICWATSATMISFSPSRVTSTSTAPLISGRAWGGNSTSMTGPAMATTRPVGRLPESGAVGCGAVVVMMVCFPSVGPRHGAVVACAEASVVGRSVRTVEQDGSVAMAQTLVSMTRPPSSSSTPARRASAPPTISMISVVMVS